MKLLRKLTLLAICILMLMPTFAWAYDEIEIEIPVKTNENCAIELSGYAEEQKDIDGSGSFTLSADRPGIYECQVRQIPGDDEYKTYDARVYHVIVYVEADEDRLSSAITLYIDGEAEKPAELAFENTAFEPVPPYEPEPDEPEPEEPEPGEETDEPTTPTQPSKPTYHRKPQSDTPKTGDNGAVRIWSGIFAGTGALLVSVYAVWRRRKNHGRM